MPFFVIPVSGMPFRLSREILAIWMGVGLVMAFTPNWWLRGLLGLALAHLIIHPASIAYWDMMLLCVFCGIYGVVRKMNDEWIQWLLMGVCLVAMVQAVLIFVQLAGLWNCAFPGGGTYPRGMFANSGDAGAFLALSWPAFMLMTRKPGNRCALIRTFGTIVILCTVVATGSTTPFLALMSGICLWILIQPALKAYRRLLIAALLVPLIGMFLIWVDPIKGTLKDLRWHLWDRTIMSIQDKPWGYGLGSYKELFPAMMANDPRLRHTEQAHNEYLQMIFELGWPFLLLVAGFFASFMHWLFGQRTTDNGQRTAACGLVILAVGCAGNFWLHLAEVGFLAIFWLAIWDRTGGNFYGKYAQ